MRIMDIYIRVDAHGNYKDSLAFLFHMSVKTGDIIEFRLQEKENSALIINLNNKNDPNRINKEYLLFKDVLEDTIRALKKYGLIENLDSRLLRALEFGLI